MRTLLTAALAAALPVAAHVQDGTDAPRTSAGAAEARSPDGSRVFGIEPMSRLCSLQTHPIGA